MTNPPTLRASEHWADKARRRSFAQGVAAGMTREQLAHEHGLSSARVRAHLTDPDIALLAWIWRSFAMIEPQGTAAVVAWLREHLLAAVRGQHGVEIGLGRLLLVLLGLTFLPLSTIGRHLLAPMARKSIPCQRGFQPFLWLCRRLVQEVASIVESVAIAKLRHERPSEVAAYLRAFVAIVREGGEPFVELGLCEPSPSEPVARCASGFAGWLVARLGGRLASSRTDGGSISGSSRCRRRPKPWWSAIPPWLGPASTWREVTTT